MFETLLIKGVIILLLLTIISTLGAALVSLVRDKGQSDRTVKALTVRISLSIGLFILVMIAIALGFIKPNTI
ncbi:MAG: twin transmembrane helix small protein [Gammaproteobacteria bacterium]